MKKSLSRINARRHAFNILYQIPYHENLDLRGFAELKAYYVSIVDEGEIEGFSEVVRPFGRDAAYINRVCFGVFERLAEIDEVIGTFLVNWTVERLNYVDLALLRLSIYEMLREGDVSYASSIDAVVELAKDYGGDTSPAFINGVLANVAREMERVAR